MAVSPRTAGGPVAYGIDEAWQRLTPAEMKAAGRTFVVGYVGENTTGKNLTPSEVAAYHAAGIAVLLVYEFSTTAVHGGASAGAANAALSVRQARADGYPAGCAIAFAVDEDTSPHPSIVDAYARAFTAGIHGGGYRSMEYGGLATVKRCADLGLTDLHWQTYAWSGGVWDPRVAIRQVKNGVMIAGKDVDLDTAMVSDFGAWMPGTGDDMALTDADVTQLRKVMQLVQNEYGWLANFLNDKDGTAYPVNATLHQILAAAAAPGSVALSPEDRAALVAALPSAADVAAHLDYDKLAAAFATHFHVS